MKDGKGFVKEYEYEYDYDDILIFEGEYINGEKNGKGKECFLKGRTKFEGEYLNGKRWSGKGYNRQHILQYELLEGKGRTDKNQGRFFQESPSKYNSNKKYNKYKANG